MAPPFDRARFQRAAYDETRRIIREEEPSKPSTKVRTLGKQRDALLRGDRSDPRDFPRTFEVIGGGGPLGQQLRPAYFVSRRLAGRTRQSP
jgi:hypothetical protein